MNKNKKSTIRCMMDVLINILYVMFMFTLAYVFSTISDLSIETLLIILIFCHVLVMFMERGEKI